MNRLKLNFQPTANQVIIGVAAFIVLFGNLAFFRNVLDTFSADPYSYAHALSLGFVQLGLLLVLLSVICFHRTTRPVLIFMLLLSSVTAYFMDTYNVIIDSDMIVNVLGTNVAESNDLLSPRLLAYLLFLGIIPSAVLYKFDIKPETTIGALRSRGMLAGSSLLMVVLLMFFSSSFYASYIREHKPLRYYTNPTTPIYAAYKFATTGLKVKSAPLKAIGEDTNIPLEDIERELVILVVGETARADHFSLNGYARDTNPILAGKDVVSLSAVSACGTSTATSLPCMFAIYDRDNFSINKAKSTENMLDVLKRADVNLFWRDNNSSSKSVADRIPYENFRLPENNTICDAECRDEGMLVGLQDYIDQHPTGDILIVLHQMSSHGPAYFKRYPPEFRVFTPTCDTNQLDSCSKDEIGNAYDNTIVYTDYFLSKVIQLLETNEERFEASMLYISDHGESLGESGLYLHGLPYYMAPDSQTHVPLIIWSGKNNEDIDIKALRQLRDTQLTHDHIFHTTLGLFEVDSEIYDPQKDILKMSKISIQ